MIEVKANTIKKENGERGVDVQATLEGHGLQIESESLAAIQGIMANLKDADKMLHTAVIRALVDEPEILLGDISDMDTAFEKHMADLTSRSIIGEGDLN